MLAIIYLLPPLYRNNCGDLNDCEWQNYSISRQMHAFPLVALDYDDKSINMYNNQAILENDKNDPILSLQFDQLLNIYVI